MVGGLTKLGTRNLQLYNQIYSSMNSVHLALGAYETRNRNVPIATQCMGSSIRYSESHYTGDVIV